MVKALFALAKSLTWWFMKPLGSRLCCKSHTHAANLKYQLNVCSSCFKQYFPFLLGGENIHNNYYFIKSIAYFPLPVLIVLLNTIPILVALKILREILLFTRLFMINTCPLIGCLKSSDWKVKEFRLIPQIASSRVVYCSLSPVFECVWFCNGTPDLYRETVMQQISC